MISFSLWLPAVLAGVSVVSAVAPAPSGSCVNDDVLNLLKGNRRQAYPFCRTLLQVDVSSTYVSTDAATSTPAIAIPPTILRRAGPLATDLAQLDPAHVSSACHCLSVPSCRRHQSTTTLEPSVITSTAVVDETWVPTSLSTVPSATVIVSESATTTTTVPSAVSSAAPPSDPINNVHIRLWTPAGASKIPFIASSFGPDFTWDLLDAAPNLPMSSAVTLHLDINNHLSMPGHTDAGGPAVFPVYHPDIRPSDDGRWLVFLTESEIAQQWNKYTFEIDAADSNRLRVFTHDDHRELFFEVCDAGDRKGLAIFSGSQPVCGKPAVSIFADILEE
ncbi:hypothetical protein QBC34DRAFT_441822 [Podospora aff. communis PSN243]|uniref:Uncharacterized protein n=1 Tax=Podospora aff. communis PSN243 TaxID=3040156 RepID=A0AAV9GAS6_9PEZI|nr:hypothetical protein QBC34DRAFT_441822 [Podospora aff. communis PSN243]